MINGLTVPALVVALLRGDGESGTAPQSTNPLARGFGYWASFCGAAIRGFDGPARPNNVRATESSSALSLARHGPPSIGRTHQQR